MISAEALEKHGVRSVRSEPAVAGDGGTVIASGTRTTQRYVAVGALRPGMYISALDRPWTETPFALQGLFVRDERDIASLAIHCRWVMVDVDRSLPVATDAFRPTSEEGAASASSPVAPPVPIKPAGAVEGGRWPGHMGFPSAVRIVRTLKAISERFLRRGSASVSTLPEVMTRRADPSMPEETIVRLEEQRFRAGIPRAAASLEHADRVLTAALADAAGSGLVLADCAREAARAVLQSIGRQESAMFWLMRLRESTEAHLATSLLKGAYLAVYAREVGLPPQEQEDLTLAGLLLDVGMLRVPAELLYKPDRLTRAEARIVRAHVRYGLEMLDETPGLPEVVRKAVREHHEREDRSGYPRGLAGSELSIYGRMAGIVDSFVSMCARRSHAPACPMGEALNDLCRDARYQTALVEAFLRSIGAFPVGSIVLLSSGEQAIVVSHNCVRRLRPRVLLLTDRNGKTLPTPVPLNLLHQTRTTGEGEVKILSAIAPGTLAIDPQQLFLSSASS